MIERKNVGVCETQPATAEGLRAILGRSQDLWVSAVVASLAQARELLRRRPPDVLVLDKSLGMAELSEWLQDYGSNGLPTRFLVWGASITDAEALRLVKAGARGVVRKTSPPETLVAAVRAVASGESWMEELAPAEMPFPAGTHRSRLTVREEQVMNLIEQGLKNKDIAEALGIRPGTVKIHLKHIFEKTGVRGRYGLALTGLRQKGLLSLPPNPMTGRA